MKPKERREKLFRDVKPEIRLATVDDLGWAYASHRVAGGEMEEAEFKETTAAFMKTVPLVYTIEDRHKSFESGFGPVGMVAARYDGWRLEPSFQWFEWASARNKLRSTVAFFISQVRYSKAVGVGELRVPENQATKVKRLKRYMPLYPVGRIPNGSSSVGTEYLFFMTGAQRKWGSSKT